MGDFNAPADGSQTLSYDKLLDAGFRDVWEPSASDGFTCCQSESLTNEASELDQRIDFIFIRGDITAKKRSIKLFSDTTFQQDQPLWASDHAGVFATIDFKARKTSKSSGYKAKNSKGGMKGYM